MNTRYNTLRINNQRLIDRIEALAQIGAIDGGGVCRLALSDEDRRARDQVVQWMRELGLTVSVDAMGNVIATRCAKQTGNAVMTGSHIDTVRTGGRYDGNLGVLAGLEVIASLNDAGIETQHPLAVAFFTNEEGARFAPDMMGSMVHQGHLSLNDMLAVTGIDGTTVEQNLHAIGYCGDVPCGESRARAFIELHVEQGPRLEQEGICIGAVESVQGISWTEWTLEGVSNHAGTTPMHLRHDAGFAAARIACFARELALEFGGDQVATVGRIELGPNLVNVIANRAVMTVDLRNTDGIELKRAEQKLSDFVAALSQEEGISTHSRQLARFEPVAFDPDIIQRIEDKAIALGHSVQRMPSGAGHDAQSFAPNCPTGMIFVPSVNGISHNVAEHTDATDIEAGANVLLHTLLELANDDNVLRDGR